MDGFAAFFDRWLKGIDNGVMDTPPVRLEIRAGRGASYLLEEQEWPIARTEYTRWYLDASPAQPQSEDGVLSLSRDVPASEQSVTYSAEVDLTAPRVVPAGKSAPCRGATFISEPMEADCVIAGYSKLVVWVSSTSPDMDIHVGVRVLDEHDREVDYVGPALIPGTGNQFYP